MKLLYKVTSYANYRGSDATPINRFYSTEQCIELTLWENYDPMMDETIAKIELVDAVTLKAIYPSEPTTN